MSDKQGSARDYIESYIEKESRDSFLSQEQPRYDPSKPVTPLQTTPLEKEQPVESAQVSEHFKVHLPTQNPIPSSSEEEKEPKETQEPQVQWAARDFKEQRGDIHETSLTLCADLHGDLMTCFKDGSWWDKAKMCEDQKQKFWSCYNAQKVFLR